jgi:hypothetical protein
MPIDFDAKRWEQVKKNYKLWWDGKLGRPLINMVIPGRDPGRSEPALPSYKFTSCYDLSVPAEDIVDLWDYQLSCSKYLADAFPCVYPNFGPGAVAAALGADLINGAPPADTVWFHPKVDAEIKDIHFKYDPNNVWMRRIKELCRAAGERWKGLVQVGMTDLGGNLDIVSTFRPSEKLLLDLYDNPDEVKRVTWEAHAAWWAAFNDINAVLKKTNPGYSSWTNIFSEEPYYMLQCDFCYMIGPDMFDEFVKPELAATCKKLKHAFYHLDGTGQLAHLDSLLEIPELRGVQWVHGDGKPANTNWPEVYRKIHEAGKFIQIWKETDDSLDVIADQIGSAESIILIGWMLPSREKDAIALCEKHGAM